MIYVIHRPKHGCSLFARMNRQFSFLWYILYSDELDISGEQIDLSMVRNRVFLEMEISYKTSGQYCYLSIHRQTVSHLRLLFSVYSNRSFNKLETPMRFDEDEQFPRESSRMMDCNLRPPPNMRRGGGERMCCQLVSHFEFQVYFFSFRRGREQFLCWWDAQDEEYKLFIGPFNILQYASSFLRPLVSTCFICTVYNASFLHDFDLNIQCS